MEGGSSSNNTTTNPDPNPNPSRNNGKAPATPSPPPPTAPSSSNQNATPRSSGLPPTPPSSLTCREQDRYMPIANVVRIMRRALPPHAKISDEAKETVQECVSEFIAFVTEEANERCRKENRKTITGEDLLWAVGRLGFDDYLDPLKTYLKRYRESEAVGLGKIEMVSRQRRHANRAAGMQVSSASHQPLARIGAGVMSNPTLMPPLPPMINPQPQSRMISPLQNPGYFNDGSNPNPNPSPNAGFYSAAAVGGEHGPNPNPNPNPTPDASFNLRGGSSDGFGGFNMPSPSTPSAGSESDISFFDLLNQFR